MTEHRLQTELRRMAHLAARSAPSDWEVTLSRERLEALEQQLLGDGPLIVLEPQPRSAGPSASHN